MAGRAAHGRGGGVMHGVLTSRITEHGTCSSSYRTRRPWCSAASQVPEKTFSCIQRTL